MSKGGTKKRAKTFSLDDLARMTQQGFATTHGEIAGVRKEMHEKFGKVETRLDRIENLLIRAHDNRLDKLDDQMRRVITLFEKKLSIPFPR